MNQSASIKDWLGHTRRDEDEIVLGAVQRLAATLDQDPDAFKRGGVLPESWYAILFGTMARESLLGADGHPVTGDFMPPMQGTRRMFAGRRTTFQRPTEDRRHGDAALDGDAASSRSPGAPARSPSSPSSTR